MDQKRVGLVDSSYIRNTREGTTYLCWGSVLKVQTITVMLIIGLIYLDEFEASFIAIVLALT